MKRPTVFISSTAEDLKPTGYRAAARDAALAAGFYPEMQEYWAAKDNPPLRECLAKVAGADVLVVVVAYRYGWVPPDQPEKNAKERKSITWLEYEKAVADGKDVLVFVVDKDHPWPQELREEHVLMLAVQQNRLTPELAADVQRRVHRLNDFRVWLNTRTRVTFTTPEDLRGKIQAALSKWSREHQIAEGPPPKACDPDRYLRALLQETSHIDIRGLQVESGKVQRFPIDELYIPLKMIPADEPPTPRRGRKGKEEPESYMEERKPIELHVALKHRKLVILGDPGAGKTTFLRRIAYGLCNSRLGLDAQTTAKTLGIDEQAFPLFLRIAELTEYIEKRFGQEQGAPSTRAAPAWLARFMAARSADEKSGLDQTFFDDIIAGGRGVFLLDGLDEAATREQRERVAELLTLAAKHFEKCRFVITSRPPAFEGMAALPDFAEVCIEPLEDAAIESFLIRWSAGLFSDSEEQAQQHCDELLRAVRSRVELRRMARNPVMLTALAVVHWHEKRLPEQRADLYESIITWLSRSRERRLGRLSAATCINRLQELALAMQRHPEGRQVQVPRRWAVEQIAGEWTNGSERSRIDAAEQFLAEEEVDSGIVVRRGDDIRFWHLTFQEFLAARAVAARSEQEQKSVLFVPPDQAHIRLSSWREVVLLLAGVLHKQGHRKVDAFIAAVLESVPDDAPLADQARCAGLLGAVVRDLSVVGYRPTDPRYQALLDRVMGIFDAERAKEIDIKVAIAAAEALGQAGDPRFSDAALDDNWVNIPAGEFLIGAQKEDPAKPNYDPDACEDEAPVHRVSLALYPIGRYPVTVGEYSRFLDAGGYESREFWSEGGFGEWSVPKDWEEQCEHPTRPVTGVSWYEATAYAAWLGLRLPTQAEWEWTARGGDGRRYPWGNEGPDPARANYARNMGCPTPVGVYARGSTPLGVLDMAGNVWEWCADWLDRASHTHLRVNTPHIPIPQSHRVACGGSWQSQRDACRCTARYRISPYSRLSDVGFRLVASKRPGGLAQIVVLQPDTVKDIKAVEHGIRRLYDSVGLDIVAEFDPEKSSWVWRLVYRTREALNTRQFDERMRDVEQGLKRALELKGLSVPQAEADKLHLEGLAQVLQALGSSEAVVQVGSLLMVKLHQDGGPDRVVVRTLDSRQAALLEKNQHLMHKPQDILEQLLTGDLLNDGRARLPPETLPA